MKNSVIYSFVCLIMIISHVTFAQNLIPFRKGEKWGYSDKTGKIVVEPSFDLTYPLCDGMGLVKMENAYGYIDSLGRFITDIKYEMGYTFQSGFAVVAGNHNVEKTNANGIKYHTVELRYGFIDKKGREVIPLKYGDVFSFQPNGLAMVGIGKFVQNADGKDYFDGKWGYINTKGAEVIPVKYNKIGIFKEGLAYAQMGSRFGFINEKDELIIPFKYDDVNSEGFIDGLAMVAVNGNWFFIDKTGKEFYEELATNNK